MSITIEQVKIIDKIIDKIEAEADDVFDLKDRQKVLIGVLTKQGFTLEEYNKIKTHQERKTSNVLIPEDVLHKEVAEIIEPINEAIQKLETKKIEYQELLGLPHILTEEEIISLIPTILTREDVEKMIPEPVKIPKPTELPETTKAINEAVEERKEIRKDIKKLDRKGTKRKVNNLSGRIKEVEDNWIDFQKMNTLRQTDEAEKFRQNLKKLKVEAAAPALFRIDDLMQKLKAQPVDLSSQCNGSNLIFNTPSDIFGIMWGYLNGTFLAEGKEFTRTGSREITMTFAPDSGEELWFKYISA